MELIKITTIISDFSRVILNVRNKAYKGTLNGLHYELSEKYFKYNFYDYFVFNEELLNFYKSQKPKYSLNIYTTGVIQNLPEVRKVVSPIFDNIFATIDFNTDKTKTVAYSYILERLQKPAGEILFIDDQQENIDAAVSAGLNCVRYTTNYELFSILKAKFNIC
jgi:FMN phosphatase YigB (HAD superfamily)